MNQQNRAMDGILRSSRLASAAKLEHSYNDKSKTVKNCSWFLEDTDSSLRIANTQDVRSFHLSDDYGFGHNLLLNNFFLHSFISGKDQDLVAENEETKAPTSSVSSSEEGMRPTIRLVSRTAFVQVDGRADPSSQDDSEGHVPTDSVSYDEEGSESTVVSLGRNIQRMSQINVISNSDIKNSEEENSASENEWKQLLSFNHSLILGDISNSEKVHKYPSILEEHNEEPQLSLDYNSKHKEDSDSNLEVETVYSYSNKPPQREKYLVNESETTGKKYQLNQSETSGKKYQLNQSETSGKKASKDYFNGNLKTELTLEEQDPTSDLNLSSHSSYIKGENRGPSSNEEFSQNIVTDVEETKTAASYGNLTTNLTSNHQNTLNRHDHQTKTWLTDEYKQEKISVNDSSNNPTSTRNHQTDNNLFSNGVTKFQNRTSGWQPTNTFEVVSKLTTENQGNSRRLEFPSNSLSLLRPQIYQKIQLKAPSKSIVEALDMIKKDQIKDSNLINVEKTSDEKSFNNRSEEANVSSEAEGAMAIQNKEKGNRLEINSLIEKIKIFIQELGAKWTEDIIDGEKKYLQDLEEAEKTLEAICVKVGLKDLKEETKKQSQIHHECEEQKLKIRTEMDAKIRKNVHLIRKLLDDKRILTEKCEQLSQSLTQKEHRHFQQIKVIEEKKSLEMKDLKDRFTASDQKRRERWTQHKVKLIKDSAYRSLEAKMKEMTRQHQEETARLKETHRHELRESEEEWTARAREESERVRVKCEQEKEEACRREREREAERVKQDLDRCDSAWQNRLEVSLKQFNQTKMTWEEDSQRQLQRFKFDREDEIRTLKKEMNLAKEEYEEKLREMIKSHEREILHLSLGQDKAKTEMREQMGKEYEETRQKFEKGIRETFRRQRDKEIEKAIAEIEQETISQIEEKQRGFNFKIKSLKERYERELSETEECERISHARYLEMKGVLAQKEEEVVYLRARLHAHTLEMGDFQRMFFPSS